MLQSSKIAHLPLCDIVTTAEIKKKSRFFSHTKKSVCDINFCYSSISFNKNFLKAVYEDDGIIIKTFPLNKGLADQ